MTSFLFSPADTQDLSTGVFYAHIVSTEPSLSATNVSQINITDAIGYVPYTLTGLIFNTIKWTFDNFTYPAYNYVTSPYGVVVCKQLGSTPVSTDPVIYYTSLDNAINQTVIFPTGKYTLNVSFPVDGIIVYRQYYNYNSGPYVNTEAIPKGLMFLLGTRNNTQSYLDPVNNSILGGGAFLDGDINFLGRNAESTTAGVNTTSLFAYNFGSRRIRVGTMGFLNSVTRAVQWTVSGSNSAPDISATNLNFSSYWTTLCTTSSLTTGWNFATSSDPTYWKYLRFTANIANRDLQEIEFYNSSMYSTDENLMSTVIDSPFQNSILDQAGFNTWTTTNGPILSNAAYIEAKFVSTTSPLFTLGSRDFKLSIDFKYPSIGSFNTLRANPNTAINNILQLATNSSGGLTLGLGTGGGQFYVTPILGTVSTTNFDRLTCTRTGSIIETTFNTNTVTTVNGSSIPSSQFQLENIGSYIRNFKVIT